MYIWSDAITYKKRYESPFPASHTMVYFSEASSSTDCSQETQKPFVIPLTFENNGHRKYSLKVSLQLQPHIRFSLSTFPCYLLLIVT